MRALFADLDPELREALLALSTERAYEAGETVMLEGAPSSGLHIVTEGWLRAFKVSPAGREQVVRFVGPGEAFNEIGAIEGGANKASVAALEPSRVRTVTHNALTDLMRSNPAVTDFVVRNLAHRVTHLMQLVEDLSLRTVVERLARMLLEHSSGKMTSRRRWSTQNEMAARLGTVPDVMNRALRTLADEGLVEIDRHELRILDRDGLRARADSAQ